MGESVAECLDAFSVNSSTSHLPKHHMSENISLGLGGGSWARGSSSGTGAVAAGAGPSVKSSAVPELTEETMKKKTLSIIDEFLNIKDMKVSARGSLCWNCCLSLSGLHRV